MRAFSEEELLDLELAVEEVVSYIILNAFEASEEADFDIQCEQTDKGIKLIVKDRGVPFDSKIMNSYDPEMGVEDISAEGLGWYLIQKHVDELEFTNKGTKGNEIQFVKYVGIEDENVKKTFLESVEPKPGHKPKSIPFKVRKTQPKETIEVSKLAYDAYTYSYFNDLVYYPEKFGKAIEDGKVISIIAVQKTSPFSIMAHNALILPEDKSSIAEMGMVFTKGEFQNQGCSRQTGLQVVKEAVKKGIMGVWGTAVTSHPYSQRSLVNTGVKECGIMIGYYPANTKWKHFDDQVQRIAAVLGYFKVPLTSWLKLGKGTVFLPKQHENICKYIYQNLNIKPSFKTSSKQELPKESGHFKLKVYDHEQKAKIYVESYGANTVKQIRDILVKLCAQKVDVIYLYLRLTNPLTAQLTSKFEQQGFFFAGILPGPKKGDQLILQYLNNQIIDYDKIVIYSEFAKELLTYVRQLDKLNQIVANNNH